MKATKLLQYVCLFQADIPTQKDGDVFMYIAVDAYSKVLFTTGVERDRSLENIIKHTKLLIEDARFKETMQRQKKFTLVYHKFSEIQTELTQIIEPYGGKMIIDDMYVTKIMMPVLHDFMMSLNKE